MASKTCIQTRCHERRPYPKRFAAREEEKKGPPKHALTPTVKGTQKKEAKGKGKSSKLSAKAFYIMTKAKALGLSTRKDEHRVGPTDNIGGILCVDEKTLTTLRAIGKEFLKQALGRIFTGNFNLTTISLPIKCMRPVSLLETFGLGGCTVPLYLNKACLLKDPVERMKYIIVTQISTFRLTSNFLKPVLSLAHAFPSSIR